MDDTSFRRHHSRRHDSVTVPAPWGGVGWLATGIVSVTWRSSAATATPKPTTQEYFICPSVSTHNAHGMWVIGAHGA